MMSLSRRSFVAASSALFLPKVAWASAGMVVHKDPGCGCCGNWVDHVRANGFAAEVIENTAMNRIKARLGVPRNLISCHTAQIGGYVIEGHVPAVEIARLLREASRATGLAVAGMPTGSPGMEAEGAEPDTYEVVQFGPGGQSVFARYRGLTRG